MNVNTTGTIEPINPSQAPSKTKGQRMNQLVAPTNFIISISLRREKIAILIVFDIKNIAVSNNPMLSIIPAYRPHFKVSNNLSTVFSPYSTLSTYFNFSYFFSNSLRLCWLFSLYNEHII